VLPRLAPDALRAALEAAGLCVDRCEITSRERREPHFSVISAFADKPGNAAPP
jgi:ArsR family transcriptional regulator